MTLSTTRLHLVGCGNMGSALLKSWLDAGVKPEHVTIRVASESSATRLHDTYGVHAATDMVYDGEDIVMLGVKPQMLDDVLDSGWQNAHSKPLYLSIAAGKTLSYFETKLGSTTRIVRAMPNTPAMVGEGVTTLVANDHATDADKDVLTQLLEASGAAIWLQTEDELNAAAAVAGSGPAYVFHFAESLLAAAQSLGLDNDTALALVKGTLKGGVALADADDGWSDLSQLRRNVTSKNGVTQAALEVLMAELPDLVKRALEANVARSKALASE